MAWGLRLSAVPMSAMTSCREKSPSKRWAATSMILSTEDTSSASNAAPASFSPIRSVAAAISPANLRAASTGTNSASASRLALPDSPLLTERPFSASVTSEGLTPRSSIASGVRRMSTITRIGTRLRRWEGRFAPEFT